jgi:hypothetical protein
VTQPESLGERLMQARRKHFDNLIPAVKAELCQYTDNQREAVKTYVDNKVSAALVTAQTYVDNKLAASKTYIDGKDTALGARIDSLIANNGLTP